jgi:hypothetical protein
MRRRSFFEFLAPRQLKKSAAVALFDPQAPQSRSRRGYGKIGRDFVVYG